MISIYIMRNIDNVKLDLNLLLVFRILMQERSVSAAARSLSLGQPAVSHALSRLRATLQDPLLVRSGRGMEPTPFALELFDQIVPALEQIEGALRRAEPFEPESVDRTFRIALSDDIQLSFLPDITRALDEVMPNARLIVRQVDYRQAGAMLEGDRASIVIAYLDKLPANAKIKKIRRVGYRIIAANGSPAKFTLSDYCAKPHVLVTFAGDLVGYIDETLAAKGVARAIGLSVPGFSNLTSLLRQTDRIATVPEYVADTLVRQSDLTAIALPFPSPKFDLSIGWRAATDRDPAERLLRDTIYRVIRNKTKRAQ